MERQQNYSIEPYTYFTGPNGLTFCCEGHGTVPNQDRYQASIVYSPSDSLSTRIRVSNGTTHQKIVLDGTAGEERVVEAQPQLATILKHLYTIDVLSGQRILSVPFGEVDEIYDPAESLALLLLERLSGMPEDVTQKIQRAVGFLMNKGIPLKDLGLYGGLQTFVLHKGKGSVLKDIDITVRGLKYVKFIRQLAQESKKYKSTTKQTRAKQVDEDIRRRRHDNSRIYLPDDPDNVHCDIKILRSSEDPLTFSRDIQSIGRIRDIYGTVIDSQESLSSPMSFVLFTNDAQRIVVSSTKYDYIGAVVEGDVIRVRASLTNVPNHLLLSDSEKHRIEYLANNSPAYSYGVS